MCYSYVDIALQKQHDCHGWAFPKLITLFYSEVSLSKASAGLANGPAADASSSQTYAV